MDCEHENATVELLEYTTTNWDQDAGCYLPDDSEDLPTLVCPDCGHEQIEGPDCE